MDAAPAGRCAGGGAVRSGPGVGRDRDRGVRAGVLRTSTRRWPRCSSIAASHCGRRRWAAGSTTTPRTMSRRCWRWACRRSGRSPAPGSGSAPRWPRRPGSRAGTSAAARRTGTGWAMRGRIRTRRTRRGAGARTGWSRTRSRRRWSGGCSPGGWPGSAARITRALNDAGMPCPSAADPGRNPHRTGAGWTLRTVAAILGNPRYTGRQVWNRQRTDFNLVDPANTGLGHRPVQRWNLPEGWVISKYPAHPALVSEADFIAAQDATAPRGPAGPPARRYLLAGLLACGRCGRCAAGISLVQRQARLPVAPRPRQRRHPGTWPAQERLCA